MKWITIYKNNKNFLDKQFFIDNYFILYYYLDFCSKTSVKPATMPVNTGIVAAANFKKNCRPTDYILAIAKIFLIAARERRFFEKSMSKTLPS